MFSVCVFTCEPVTGVCVCIRLCMYVYVCVFSLARWMALSHHMLLVISAAHTVFFLEVFCFSAAPSHQNCVSLQNYSLSLCLSTFFFPLLFHLSGCTVKTKTHKCLWTPSRQYKKKSSLSSFTKSFF